MDEFAITGMGMVSPLAHNLAESFMYMRANLSGVRELPEIYFCLPDDPEMDDYEVLKGATVDGLGHRDASRMRDNAFEEWLGYLAGLAYRDMTRTVGDLQGNPPLEPENLARAGLYLSMSADVDARNVVYHVQNYAQIDTLPVTQVTQEGHTGVFSLLERACRDLKEGKIDHALLGGVESYFRQDTLARLDKQFKIRSARAMDGFIPGENAAFLRIEKPQVAKKYSRRVHARLSALLATHGDPDSVELRTGKVLSDIVNPMLQNQGAQPLIVCDLNGVSRRMKEWGYVRAKLGEKLSDGHTLVHPVSSFGELGAAAGASLLCVAVNLLKRPSKNSNYDQALVWCASDDGKRAIAAVRPGEFPVNRFSRF